MAGLEWGKDDPRDSASSFGRDDAIELPSGVTPSAAGGGRGIVNPPVAQETVPEIPLGNPAGSGFEEIMAQPRKRQSVLEGVDLPEPTVTPENDAENARLSNRRYAERTPLPDAPPQTVAKQGTRQKPNAAADLGSDFGAADPVTRVLGKASSSAAQGAFGTLRAGAELVGADKVADFARQSSQAATDFEQGMGKPKPLQDFNPRGPMPYLQEMAEGAASSVGQSASYALAFGPRAVIPLISLQSAGQQYQQAREAGKTPGEAIANAVPYGLFEALGEKVEGLDKAAKALNVIASGTASREALHSAGQALVHAGIREIPGELVTYLGQTGVDLLPGIGINNDLTVPQFLDGLRDTAVQAAMMGVATGAGGAAALLRSKEKPPEKTAEEIAREKGFLVRQQQVERLNKEGEKEVAGTMQRQLDSERAQAELQTLSTKSWGQDDDFKQRYLELRTAGTKPAEAAARAAMASSFGQVAKPLGLTDKAMQKAIETAAGLPLEKVPAFLEGYVQSLGQRGMAQPVQPGIVEGAIGGPRDDALATQLGNVYQEDTPAPTADAITKLEQQADAGSASKTPESGSQAALAATNGEESASGTANPGAAPPAEFGGDDTNSNDHGAHQAAVSPKNDLPEPTKAQILGGNAPLGHMVLGAGAEGGQVGVTIENPEGSVRRDLKHEPPNWQTPMEHGYHYGRFKGTKGADGDHIDGFFKTGLPENWTGTVWIVDQVNPKTGKFDEHKVLVGPSTYAEARQAYLSHYEKEWKGAGQVSPMPWAEFRQWLNTEQTTPVSKSVPMPTQQEREQQMADEGEKVTKPPDGGADSSLSGAASSQQTPAESDESGPIGRDSTSLKDGGKPFRTELEARKAKRLHPDKRVVRVEGGFALVAKTPAQLEAEARAAKRLRTGATEKKGQPIAAHAFIAGRGGLHKDAMSELGFDKNLQVGSRWLFAKDGGLTLEQATELLHQHGYISEEDQRAAIDTLSRSAKGEPQYAPEGWEAIAQAEGKTQFEDFHKAISDDPSLRPELDAEALQGSGFEELEPNERDQFYALVAAAHAEGIDTEAILRQAEYATRKGSEDDFTDQGLKDYRADAARRIDAARAARSGPGAAGGEGHDRAAGAGQGGQPADQRSDDSGGEVQGAAGDQSVQRPQEEVAPSLEELTRNVVALRKRVAVLRRLRDCVRRAA
jgi:hypothetical protein